MSTPLGWHQACLLYDKLVGIPEPGSLREAVCILIQRHRQETEYTKTMAIVAAAAGESQHSVLMDAVEQFRDLMFPYIQRTKRDLQKEMKAVLERAFTRGPMRVNRSIKSHAEQQALAARDGGGARST
tara:strand:+ start:278 stop:661 length:384 start_codon:yes stop_codon:yes gene_type:complete